MKGTRKCFRVDRDNVCSQQEQGGGVAILIPKRFKSKLREDLNFFHPAWFEGLWVEITFKKSTHIISVCYNPLRAYYPRFIDNLTDGLEIAVKEKKTINSGRLQRRFPEREKENRK